MKRSATEYVSGTRSHAVEGSRLEHNEPFVSEPCRRFYDQWSGLITKGITPHSRDFLTDPDPSLISNVYILEVTDQGPLIRFMGTGLVEIRGQDLTDKIFGAGLPEDAVAGLKRNCVAVAGHPCGFSEIAEFSTSTGRFMRMETVMLPLAVDEGRANRLCTFSQIIETSGEDDLADMRFKAGKRVGWIDIGAGVPEMDPATDRKA